MKIIIDVGSQASGILIRGHYNTYTHCNEYQQLCIFLNLLKSPANLSPNTEKSQITCNGKMDDLC